MIGHAKHDFSNQFVVSLNQKLNQNREYWRKIQTHTHTRTRPDIIIIVVGCARGQEIYEINCE